MTFKELDASPDDLRALRSFYDGLYTDEFPDPDERESYENMVEYLRAVGTSENGYHIVFAIEADVIVGATITDYFFASNSGVIEFIVVAPDRRCAGRGSALLRDAEERLAADAARRGRALAFVAAEINDPFRPSKTVDNIDPFDRARWWGGRGYVKSDFPYVQPPLSGGQHAVRNLLIAVKPFALAQQQRLSAQTIESFVRDYLVYAMRIPDPAVCPEFAEMSAWLRGREAIETVALERYIGEDHRIEFREIIGPQDPRLTATLAVYRAVFSDPATMVPAAEFSGLLEPSSIRRPYTYHLWALEATQHACVAGIASFFSLGTAGFGGYVGLKAPLRGIGALAVIIARIERQLIRDAQEHRGWYIECADERTAALFAAHGFFEIALSYSQPPLGAAEGTARTLRPHLHLLYREFGARYEPPALGVDGFLRAVREIFAAVYAIARPEDDPSYRHLVAQVGSADMVDFIGKDE
jgi:GNAT superfamily N-acetyltransferase